jgi:hypothetical protein
MLMGPNASYRTIQYRNRISGTMPVLISFNPADVGPRQGSASFDTHLEHEFYPCDTSMAHGNRVRGSKENFYARYGD